MSSEADVSVIAPSRAGRVAAAIDRGLRAAAFGSARLVKLYGFAAELVLCLGIGVGAAWLAVSAIAQIVAH